MARGEKKVVDERKVIREIKYCQVYKAVSIIDDDYYSSIQKIKVKSKNREEVRFALYKDTFKMERQLLIWRCIYMLKDNKKLYDTFLNYSYNDLMDLFKNINVKKLLNNYANIFMYNMVNYFYRIF